MATDRLLRRGNGLVKLGRTNETYERLKLLRLFSNFSKRLDFSRRRAGDKGDFA